MTMTLLVSDLGQGPWGIDFDPISGNLFIANFRGDPNNGIVQITGFPAPIMDSDGDGVPDHLDVCAGGDDNVDSDGDLVPDLCDDCPLHAEDDPDGDGVCGSPLILSCEGFGGDNSSLAAELLDESGVMVTDGEITAPFAEVLFFSVDGSDPVDVSSEVAPADFSFSDGMWRTMLAKEQMEAPGTYAVTMESNAALDYMIAPTCSLWIMQEVLLPDDTPKCSKKASKKCSKKASRKCHEKASKKCSKKASKKCHKKASKKCSKKASKKCHKKGSKKCHKKGSKKASKKHHSKKGKASKKACH
jgi:hypothetical protein